VAKIFLLNSKYLTFLNLLSKTTPKSLV